MALNIKPLGDRLLVEPVEEKEVKKGGIIIPDTAKEKPQEGVIRASGRARPTTTARKSHSKSRSATACSSANTAARKSSWTARSSRFLAPTTCWRSLTNPIHQ